MHFSILSILSFSAFALAAPAPPYPYMSKRQTTYTIQACIDLNLEGQSTELEGTYGTCTNVPADFNDDISSLAGDQNTSCFIFRDEGCVGDYFEIATSEEMPLIPAEFNDDISSVMCPDYLMD